MKKQDILPLLKLLSVPVFLILLGLILIVHPDAASVMIATVVGYVLIAGAVIGGVAAVVSPRGKLGKALFSIALGAIGIWLVQNPLILAAGIGRFVGVMILINSLPDLIYAHRQGRTILPHGISVLTGVVLLLLPMTASRLVFTLGGVAVTAIGIFMFADRIRGHRWLDAGDDPNIIDAL